MTGPSTKGPPTGPTPRPWEVGGPYPGVSVIVRVSAGTHEDPPEYEPVAILSQRTGGEPDPVALANAALIVRAVNAHDELVAALREVLADGREAWLPPRVRERARAALATQGESAGGTQP